MTMREALERAMGRTGSADAMQQLQAAGLTVASEDSVSQAIHDVFCGILADHQHPNEKDREQARALMGALQKHAAEHLNG